MRRRRRSHREATPGTHPIGRQDRSPRRVLVLSASMGAGHDGAANELATRLRRGGHEVEIRDFVRAAPVGIGRAVKAGYKFELSHAPSMYEATYQFWDRVPWLCPIIAWLVCTLTGRRVRHWARQHRSDVVVSTYPLATLCLGRLR
ncbi:MAG: UDP-N-acetylglucosamine--N-acetylglucosamine transferase, partial [Actinomycetota bacterium]|nr:UDP-N-acetylglucosamine--N-acetylglucosamine transferase [Actinomycetota bacterium]